MNSVQVIVRAFVVNLAAMVEENVVRRALEAVKLSHGLPIHSSLVASDSGISISTDYNKADSEILRKIVVQFDAELRPRRPKQLCPVPGCRGLAAPFFGMVCGEHRNVSKQKIARYRIERT